MTIAVVANSVASAKSMSGGDRILIELSKRWIKAGESVNIYSCTEGITLVSKNIPEAPRFLLSTINLAKYGVIIGYIGRIIQSVIRLRQCKAAGLVYSSSDFLTDLIPSCILKWKSKRSRLVSAFYLRAPNPFTEKYGRTIRGLAYFFSQRIALSLMKRHVDRVYVLNDYDKDFLDKMGLRNKVKVIRGGVDIEFIKSVKPSKTATYDACFIGRIHEQKGVDDLIEIWKHTCKARRQSKLAIIGWGEERRVVQLKNTISHQELDSNIDFLGFLDGADKIAILKASKMLLFPSLRESWGLVVCEAMAAEVPVVSYDLNVLRRAFPAGLTTVPLGDRERFSRVIIELLENAQSYQSLRSECIEISRKFGWNEVAQETLADFKFLRS